MDRGLSRRGSLSLPEAKHLIKRRRENSCSIHPARHDQNSAFIGPLGVIRSDKRRCAAGGSLGGLLEVDVHPAPVAGCFLHLQRSKIEDLLCDHSQLRLDTR
jgi:hypothetical protein